MGCCLEQLGSTTLTTVNVTEMGQKHGGGLESEGTIKGVKKYLNNEDAKNCYNTHQMDTWEWKCFWHDLLSKI